MPGEIVKLHLEGEERPVTIRHTARRTLGIYVFPGGAIELRVPHGTPRDDALDFARARSDWLARSLADCPAGPARPHYGDGGLHPYLGEPLTLRTRRSGRSRCVHSGDTLWISTPAPDDPERVEAALRGWYRRQAHRVFAERIAARFPALGLPPHWAPSMKIRAMRSRWGSCSSRGGVTLNLWLIRAPFECVDYVVVHELCHLLQFNHGPRFYAEMDRILPEWRDWSTRLREHQRHWG